MKVIRKVKFPCLASHFNLKVNMEKERIDKERTFEIGFWRRERAADIVGFLTCLFCSTIWRRAEKKSEQQKKELRSCLQNHKLMQATGQNFDPFKSCVVHLSTHQNHWQQLHSHKGLFPSSLIYCLSLCSR